MEQLSIIKETPAFSSDGYLLTPQLWSEIMAIEIAKCVGIEEMSEGHWSVINYVRGYWENNGTAPLIKQVCQNTGFRLGQLQELFPTGLARGACRIAGLPKPDGCV